MDSLSFDDIQEGNKNNNNSSNIHNQMNSMSSQSQAPINDYTDDSNNTHQQHKELEGLNFDNDLFNEYIFDTNMNHNTDTKNKNNYMTTQSHINNDHEHDFFNNFIKSEDLSPNNLNIDMGLNHANMNNGMSIKASSPVTMEKFIPSPSTFIHSNQDIPINIPNTSKANSSSNNSISSNHIINTLHDNMKNITIQHTNEKNLKKFIDNTIEFGRTDNITSQFIDPTNFVNLEENDLPFHIDLNGLPSVTRVENQLKLSLIMSPNNSNNNKDALIRSNFDMVYLPIDCITREKFFLSKNITDYPQGFQDQLLYLDAFVIDSITNRNIKVCIKCVNREQRRASRRKSGLSDNMLWCNNDYRRAIIFNNKQISTIQRFSDNDNIVCQRIDLTTRIVCYCRHHKSDNGFKLLFILKDKAGNILAKTTSNSIMITDKKQQILAGNAVSNTNKQRSNKSEVPLLSNNHIANFNSDSVQNGISSSTLTMNPSSMTDNTTSMNEHSNSASTTPGQYFDVMDHSQLSSNMPPPSNFHQSNSSLPIHQMGNSIPRRIIPSPTSMSEEGSEPITMNSYSANSLRDINSSSRKRSRVSVPTTNIHNNNISNGQYSTTSLNAMHHMNDFNYQSNHIQKQQHSLSQQNLINNTSNTSQQQLKVPSPDEPSIQRVIPSRGPINGGIEVTLLGSKFKQGLVVKFGDNIALSTQCWSETTILTYLPPAASAGQVFVTIADPNDMHDESSTSEISQMDIHPSKKAIFTYVDETDRQLIELALQIVGLKMNGKLEDAKNIAKRIVDDDGKSPGGSQQDSNGTNNDTGGVPYNGYSHNILDNDDEQLIIKVINSLNKTTSNFSVCDNLGRTMLHLAALKGYMYLVVTLIKSGVNVNVKDTFGFTPLHFAAIGGSSKIIKLLLACKADIFAVTSNNITPKELYIDNHYDSDEQEDIAEMFDYYLDDFDNPMSEIGRKLSCSSFSSSVFDNESMSSFREENNLTKIKTNQSASSIAYMGSYEYSENDECDFEDNEDYKSDRESVSSLQQHDPTLPSNYADGTSNIVTTNSKEVVADDDSQEPSLWNRMLTRLNDDLPKYDELFPRNSTNDKNKTQNITEISYVQSGSESMIHDVNSTYSHTSSEDEEDMFQKSFKMFFQENRLSFRKDKMLLFFWIPLMVILLSWVSWVTFSPNDNDIVLKVHGFIKHYLGIGLAKILLGNQRVKTVFRDSINNLQTSGILNDLIVS